MYGYQGEGVGGMNWETGTDIYIYTDTHTIDTMYIKLIINENLLYSTGNST